MNENITILTTTFYKEGSFRDTIRKKLAIQMIKNARNMNFEVFVVDGGSEKNFFKTIQNFGAKIFVQKNTGMGASRREVFELAKQNSKNNIFAWLEPEKIDMINYLSVCAEPILKKEAEFVIPRRVSMESYPENQVCSEIAGNLFWKNLTNFDFDMWFGVRIMTKKFLDFFINYNGEYGDLWDFHFIPIIDILKSGTLPISISINYTHPKEQTAFESKEIEFFEKRIEQLYHITKALKKHWIKK